MPWPPSKAPQFDKKANTSKKMKLWSKIANSTLRRTGSDARAIREASAVIARMRKKKK